MNEACETLDVCGPNCPLPILKTRKTIAKPSPGEALKLLGGERRDACIFVIRKV